MGLRFCAFCGLKIITEVFHHSSSLRSGRRISIVYVMAVRTIRDEVAFECDTSLHQHIFDSILRLKAINSADYDYLKYKGNIRNSCKSCG